MLFVLSYFLFFLVIWKFSMSQSYQQGRKTQAFLCFLLLFIFFGFRDLPILNDTGHYYGHYYEMLSDSAGLSNIFRYDPYERFEYGYQVLERLLINYVSTDPYTIIMFSSFVFTICNIFLFKKYTQRIALALFLFFINIPQYNTIRQSFAIMVFYLAFEQLLKKKYLWYIALTLLALLFHRSAIVLFMLPLLCLLNVNKKNVIYVLLGSFVVGYMIYPILQLFNITDSIYYETAMERDSLPIGQIINAFLYILMAACSYKIWGLTKAVTIPKPFVWASILTISLSIISIPFGIMFRYVSYFSPYLFIMFIFCVEHSQGNVYVGCDGYSATLEGCYHIITPQARRILIFFILLNIAKFIVTCTFKNEWSHLIPYSFYDFVPGIHNYYFGY